MNKRKFLKLSAITATGLMLHPFYACTPTPSDEGGGGAEQPDIRTENFVLPALAFAADALEPNIDKRTMEIHHGKHHAGYVRKLNAAVADTRFDKMPLLNILDNITEEDTAVRNNGGGHFNHSLFWNIISPNSGGEPQGALAAAIAATFGSFAAFKEAFSTAAKTRFGSGWAWLSVDAAGKLFVSSTPNQDNPLMSKIVEQQGTPVLGIDVWEHAYYLHYQNKRGDYVENFFKIINWKAVSDNFKEVTGVE
jgi:Fe-Mn family superoxide dismutase